MITDNINHQDILTIIDKQFNNNWLINYNNLSLLNSIEKHVLEIEKTKSKSNTISKILILESKPLNFIPCFLAAIITKTPVFLGNPQWKTTELKQVKNLIKPNLIWQNNSYKKLFSWDSTETIPDGAIAIATGGSSGKIRFAIHTIDTITASVRGFSQYFATPTVNCCCILPLYHISGLIQLWRSLLSGGNLAIVSYENIKKNITPAITPQDYFLSLVPTQLQFLLDCNPDWVGEFKTVLLGGAPAWQSLLDKARQNQIALSTTYGMTETASGISYLKPQDFLQGNYSSGRILPHAKAEIIDSQNEILAINEVGVIKIKSDSLFYGYYGEQKNALEKQALLSLHPNHKRQNFLITDDLGFIDAEGFLHIVGRNSQKIITGGENVYPQEVEAAILATKLVKDVCVIGLKDDTWGQAVTALFVPLDREIEIKKIQQRLQTQLSKYKQPKYWLATNSLFRDSKGKLSYSQLATVAQELLKKTDIK